MIRSRHRVAPVLILLAGTGLLAAGCSTSAAPPATSVPDTTVAPAPTSAPATTAAPTGGSFDVTCDELVPESVLSALASGFTADTAYSPAAGTNAAQILSDGGVACRWETPEGDELLVAAAQPTQDQLTTAETAIGNSGTASTLFGADVKAWTPAGGGTFPGEFDVFPGDTYWVSMTSSLFTGPDSTQATTVYSAIAQALPSG